MAASNKGDVKKPNIFVRMGRKLKETFSELKRVTWPTFPKVLKSTGVVLVVVLVFLVVVTGINFGLQALLDRHEHRRITVYGEYRSAALLVYPSYLLGLRGHGEGQP